MKSNRMHFTGAVLVDLGYQSQFFAVVDFDNKTLKENITMKLKKKFAKKLAFQKSTVANLNEIELKKIYGGVSLTECRTEGITHCKACGSKFGGC